MFFILCFSVGLTGATSWRSTRKAEKQLVGGGGSIYLVVQRTSQNIAWVFVQLIEIVFVMETVYIFNYPEKLCS